VNRSLVCGFFIFLLYWVDPQKSGEKKRIVKSLRIFILFSFCLKRVIGDITEDDNGLEDGGPKVISSSFFLLLSPYRIDL